ncbi:MAG TPA: hypothetical protein VFD60_13980 [Nitrososphaeraceae archaeon]|jgi:hypothetical protein|nr:hypothetical protein [Nitrososphaeraceae archaeon]
MEAKTVFISSSKALTMIATITVLLMLTMMPIKGHAALCAKPDKSATYFNGYNAAQSDFHSGHPQNQNVTGGNSQYSQDYKQGYKDGWDDAQYSINVLEGSIC